MRSLHRVIISSRVLQSIPKPTFTGSSNSKKSPIRLIERSHQALFLENIKFFKIAIPQQSRRMSTESPPLIVEHDPSNKKFFIRLAKGTYVPTTANS